MSFESPLPEMVAFLACEIILQDSQSGAKTLVNVAHQLNATAAPFPAKIACYAKLVDGGGEYQYMLRLVDLNTDAPIFQYTTPPAPWPREMDVYELIINLQGVTIPYFGDFEFQLHANGAYLGRHVLKVREMNSAQGPPAQS